MSSDEPPGGIALDRLRGRPLHVQAGGPHPLEIYEREDGLRALHFGSQATQSLLDPGQPQRLILPYQQSMMSARLFLPRPRTAWLLGLGGGALMHHLYHHLPDILLVAVDNDPRVVEAGRAWFGLDGLGDRMESCVADAGDFLRQRQRLAGATELLLIDLFDGQRMSALMADMAFYRHCHAVLAPTGVLAANMLFASEQEFLQVVGGLREIFDRRVLCLTVAGYNNVIVLAFKQRPEACERKALHARAKELHKETGLSYRSFVDRLFHINPNEDGRLIL